MAIDTAVKRKRAMAARRIPGLRRFLLPLPDNNIDGGDRAGLLGHYYEVGSRTVSSAGSTAISLSGPDSSALSGGRSSSLSRSGAKSTTIDRP